MSELAIQAEGLSKLYRIGLQERMHETLGGAVASFVRAPLRNYRRLRGLTTFSEEDTFEPMTPRISPFATSSERSLKAQITSAA